MKERYIPFTKVESTRCPQFQRLFAKENSGLLLKNRQLPGMKFNDWPAQFPIIMRDFSARKGIYHGKTWGGRPETIELSHLNAKNFI